MRFALLLALTAISLLLSAHPADAVPERRRLVILNATDPYLPAFVIFERALRETVAAQSLAPVEFFSETLDMHRFPRDLLESDVLALLAQKYRSLPVDVVLAVTPIAVDFAQHHRDAIWPGAAIAFAGVSPNSLARLAPEPPIHGIPFRMAFERTLELALRLKPDTRQIAVISGAGPCCDYLDHLKEILGRHAAELEPRYLIDLSLEELLKAVAALPESAVVLFTAIFREPNGRPLVPLQVLEQVAEVAPVPIFSVYGSQVGHGVTAGWMVPFDVQGHAAGELIAGLLNGADPATIGIQPPLAAQCIADWQWLRRWGIAPGRLPEDCELRFRAPSLWQQYHRQVLLVLAVVLAQMVLILALLVQQRRLRQTQAHLSAEVARRAETEDFASRLRTRLDRFKKERSLGVMAATIAHEINQPLIAIQNYAQAAKRRLQGRAPDMAKLAELVAKIDGQSQRAGDITQRVRSLVSNDAPDLHPVALRPLMDAVASLLEPELRRVGCALRRDQGAEDIEVLADPLQLQLVLVNLLQNAMQSLSAGAHEDRSIRVEACPVSEAWEPRAKRAAEDAIAEASKGMAREETKETAREVTWDANAAAKVQISVADRGGGVPAGRAEEIFEQFSSGRGGMGLGLAVSRAIVEAHGGRLWHEPNPGGGAILRFTLKAPDHDAGE